MGIQTKEALIAEINSFKKEALKMHIVEVLANTYEHSSLFDCNIDVDGSVIWYKAQARQLWDFWQAAKVQVPEGFVLVKKRNLIGNPNVDFLQAPRWAKYWLMDGNSKKYWWSSVRPKKDMDLLCYVWGGQHFVEEAPSFGFTGPWNESLTSKKAMIEAQEQSHE